MKTRLTHLILATILVSGCDHTKIKTTENSNSCQYRSAGWPEDYSPTMNVEYTNTSSSKYIEATIKYTYKNGTVSTYTKRLKPGAIETSCEEPTTKISIVGEREIKDND